MPETIAGRKDVEAAVVKAVLAALRAGRILPVRSTAMEIVRELGCSPSLATAISDALSQHCIRSGVIVEFDAPEVEPPPPSAAQPDAHCAK
jgi:hypothetical protein